MATGDANNIWFTELLRTSVRWVSGRFWQETEQCLPVREVFDTYTDRKAGFWGRIQEFGIQKRAYISYKKNQV